MYISFLDNTISTCKCTDKLNFLCTLGSDIFGTECRSYCGTVPNLLTTIFKKLTECPSGLKCCFPDHFPYTLIDKS